VSNGVLTITNGTASQLNYQIATAFPASSAAGWSGHSFGGGAYFEVSLSFDASGVMTANGWPSFWSAAIESWANKGAAQWPGQATGYDHAIEDDFFEYDDPSTGANVYGAALHDWYGIYKATCAPSAYCSKNNTNAPIHTPTTTDWSQFHTISQLWVSGATNCGNGYVQNYFDGQLMSKVTWVDSGAGTPPPTGSFTFSIIDQDHLNIVLGSGLNQPLQVDYVHVWQLPSAAAASGTSVVTPQAGFNGK
jgi:hypothetical protein